MTRSATTPLMTYSMSGQLPQAVDVEVSADREQQRQTEHGKVEKHNCNSTAGTLNDP